MLKDGEKPAFLMEKAKTKIDKREASQPTKVGSKVEELPIYNRPANVGSKQVENKLSSFNKKPVQS